LSNSMLRVCTRRVPLARCLAVSSSRLNFFGGYKVKSSRDRFEAGGRIGIETMVYEEKHILAELISFFIIKAASNEELRKNADLRMDWVTTLELVQLHVEMVRERLLQLDLDGELLMDQISRRVVLNMEQRKKDFEAATKVLIPTKDALSIISTRGHIYERNIAYTKGFLGSDMELAESLWTYLAHQEEFQIEDDESEDALIIDRYFNPEGIEYLVHYVRKNLRLMDEKTFMDYKLAANLVDTDDEKFVAIQRHFREYVFNFVLPEDDPLVTNREQLETALEFDYGRKQDMSFFERIGMFGSSKEAALEKEVNILNLQRDELELYLENKDRLNLFDQTGKEWKRKSGRIWKV